MVCAASPWRRWDAARRRCARLIGSSGSTTYPANRLEAGGTGWGRAVIMAQLGETGKALDEIEQLLARPGTFSVHELRLDPEFDLDPGRSTLPGAAQKVRQAGRLKARAGAAPAGGLRPAGAAGCYAG